MNTPTAVINYLGHIIEIELDDPIEGNDIKISIHSIYHDEYDSSDLSRGYVTDYQFSAENQDPNQWLSEAIDSATWHLTNRGIKFSDYRPVEQKTVEIDESVFEF